MESLHQLIEGCKERSRHAQHALYKQLCGAMMGVCLRYAANRQEAEEILQEGFLKVFEKIDQYQGAGAFEGWVRRIMVNTALQRHRLVGNKLKPVALPDNQQQSEPGIPEDISGRLQAKELMQCVQQLPPMYRMVFNLYVLEGMKHKDIAAALGISEGTSKSNLSDARQLLQKMILKQDAFIHLNPVAHE